MNPASVPLVRYSVSVRVPAWGEHPAVLLDEDTWHVRAIELDEALDRPYALELTLVTEELDLDLDPLVGAPLTLCCRRDDERERLVHGVVEHAWYLGTFGSRLHLRLTVGPALGRLRLSRRSRVFQGMTVVQIVEAVVAEAFEPLGRTLDCSRLLRSYDARDYCVQLRETDLELVTRILAEEGIGVLFEHGESAETMVLFDDPRAFAAIGADDGEAAIPTIAVSTSQADRAGLETITRFEWRRRARPRRVERSAWDWKPWQPERNVGRAEDEDVPPWAFGEHYEHGQRRMVEEGGDGPHLDHTPRAALDAHEGLRARSQTALGQGNVLLLSPGRTFELEGHPLSALDRGYALVRVIHRADCPEADIDDPGRFAGPNYENRFECIPEGVSWRPRVPDKPRVHGHLLATVVGPPGEEIHTDEHGRIKAWIHWDREHEPGGADASCWLRVAQAWAGPGFGTMFIPRVGMEILVSFADGDPDQPLCIGCVYQGHNRPPYPLPQERTKSTIKSRSTPPGAGRAEGTNELRFEDATGSEQVYLHAQRDLDEVVGRNHDRRVGVDETIAVGNDRHVRVSGSQQVTIEGSQRVVVKGTSPKGLPLPPPHYAIEVERELVVDASERVTVRAPVSITLAVQGTSLTLTPQGLVLTAGSGASTTIDAGVLLRSSPGATLDLDGSGGLAMAAMTTGGTPGASLALDAVATLGSQAGAGLTLGGDVSLHAPTAATAPGASLTLDTGATVSGHAVALRAEAATVTLDTDATVEGIGVTLRGTDVTCEGTKTSLRGQQLSAQAMALLTMAAPLVKIN
ncbi:type VI secretion system Vgr family protein [Paraliomyxa miuraensis]|uniref:type VI secretion system Vgr family protein n=1 Tax=Paraliomyxa miuraensis TaxID=376150 RepID=UPI00225669C4|nr:type VI secretion system tip protein TssI/VgrG [Paraliomyxa miuraensis]MCX4240247.1 type VI secretion system tip protein VgrG [Paraliomyxa miuraensis]